MQFFFFMQVEFSTPRSAFPSLQAATTVFILHFISCITSQLQEIQNPEVNTSSGTVLGTTTYHNAIPLRTYLGIPYAKPPLCDLRFKRPEPVECSCTPISANRMPQACIQYTTSPFPWRDDESEKSEDCLYLNIWVPADAGPNCKKAVMFWIFGGSFLLGSNSMSLYDGRILAADGDVIVVTINYRLGAFGFLSSNTEDAPGNMGLYDMLEALKWTRDNIEAFGGDPDEITVFGESAGSVAVGLLCISPLARGLFRKAIMESGSPASLRTDDNSQNLVLSQQLAKAVGCATEQMTIMSNPQEVIDCMRGIDAMQLSKTLASLGTGSTRAFSPMFGDSLLPRNHRKAVIDGDFNNVDVLIGANRDEGSFRLSLAHQDVFGFFGEKDPPINKTYGKSLMLQLLGNFKENDSAVDYYLGNLAEDDYEEVRYQTHTSSGDLLTLCPIVYFAESYEKYGNKVYFYFFNHRPSNTPWAPWMGVVHFEEVQFVFGSPLKSPANYTFPEVMLSEYMVRTWSNFAKTGQPDSVSMWPLYSRRNPVFMYLDTKKSTTGFGPHRENCNFYRSYFGFQ